MIHVRLVAEINAGVCPLCRFLPRSHIKRAHLVEGRDYVAVPLEGVSGKFDSIEYHLTLDAASHVAMTTSGLD